MATSFLQFFVIHGVANRRSWPLRYFLTILLIVAGTGLKLAIEDALRAILTFSCFPRLPSRH